MKSSAGFDLVGQVAQDESVLEAGEPALRAGQIVHSNKIDLWIAEAARKTLRPMRPKPLMPTLTAMCVFSLVCVS